VPLTSVRVVESVGSEELLTLAACDRSDVRWRHEEGTDSTPT